MTIKSLVLMIVFFGASCSDQKNNPPKENSAVIGGFPIFSEEKIKNLEQKALAGDKDSAVELSYYYFNYSSIDHKYAIEKEVYWLDVSLKLKDCRAINRRYLVARHGVDTEGDITYGEASESYMIAPDPKLKAQLELWHSQWNCADPLDTL